MEQDISKQASSPLLAHCPKALPAHYYYDAQHFDLERKAIWGRSWVYAGRASDLPRMTVRRFRVAGENLILVRDADGNINCFHNTCRHRGSELCLSDETRLKSRLITCPYHEWTYDLSGRLVRTPFVSITSDFRKDGHSLFSVHVKLWNGFIFVCLADHPPELTPDLGINALGNWPMGGLVTGHTLVKEIACNWKIFWENYNECLHCPGIHPELCDMVPVYGRGYMAENEAPEWRPGSSPPQVLRNGARSWTMDGKACGAEFPQLTEEQRDAGHTFVTLLPTMYIVAHADYVRTVSLRPLAPERTELRAEWLFPEATLKAPGFDLDNVVKFATLVITQDGAACEMNQRGLRSSRFTEGTLMPQEFDVFRFQQWVRLQLSKNGVQ